MRPAVVHIRASLPGNFLRWVVGTIDAALRCIHGVTEFEAAADGLLRIEIGRAERDVTLSDGTRIGRGDMVMELHLWNEQMIPVSPEGGNLAWAVRIRRQTFATLHRLALHLREDREFDAVRAMRMKPAIASRRPAVAFARVLTKIGFEPVDGGATDRGPVGRFFDNLWLLLLTWAHNPEALKSWRFDRRRWEFWISRARFVALYESDAAMPARRARGRHLPGAAPQPLPRAVK